MCGVTPSGEGQQNPVFCVEKVQKPRIEIQLIYRCGTALQTYRVIRMSYFAMLRSGVVTTAIQAFLTKHSPG